MEGGLFALNHVQPMLLNTKVLAGLDMEMLSNAQIHVQQMP